MPPFPNKGALAEAAGAIPYVANCWLLPGLQEGTENAEQANVNTQGFNPCNAVPLALGDTAPRFSTLVTQAIPVSSPSLMKGWEYSNTAKKMFAVFALHMYTLPVKMVE